MTPEARMLRFIEENYPNKKRVVVLMNPLKNNCFVEFTNGEHFTIPYLPGMEEYDQAYNPCTTCKLGKCRNCEFYSSLQKNRTYEKIQKAALKKIKQLEKLVAIFKAKGRAI